MCIIVTEPPRIAEEDIVAYKVLEIQNNDVPRTPFKLMPIEFNRLYTDTGREWGFNRITFGVYHLFSSIEDAILLKNHAQKNYTEYNKSVFIVVKAVIPKGTKYYVGKSKIEKKLNEMFQYESYGAKSVIYKELDA